MLILALTAGILPAIAIVFSGVWMVLYWSIADRSTRRALSVAMVASLTVILICFLRIAPAAVAGGAAVLLLTTIAYAVSRAKNRHHPPDLARASFKPLAVFDAVAAVVSTVALFAALQQGPRAGLPIFEMTALAAGFWALMLVGGVWAKTHMPPSRNRMQRRDAVNRYGQSPFRKFPG